MAIEFGQISTAHLGKRNVPKTSSEKLRYYKERQPQLANMDEVIGTTTAPSDQHQFAGMTADGYAIWKKVAPAPAPPPPPPPAPAPPPPPPPQPAPSPLQIQYETYRQQADQALAEAQAKAARLESEEYQRQQAAELQSRLNKEAAELQNRLSIQSQASKERGSAAPTLRIGSDSQTSQTAGTSAFKRRRDQTTLAPIQSTTGINAPARSVLNV